MTNKIDNSLSRADALHDEMEGNDGALRILRTQFLICSRFSHAMRSHLGVAMNVIEDFLQGYQLSRIDIEDARHALRAMLRTMNSFRELAIEPRVDFRKLSLYEFLAVAKSDHFFLNSRISVKITLANRGKVRALDPKLLLRALRTMVSYIETKTQCCSHWGEKQISLDLGIRKSLPDIQIPRAVSLKNTTRPQENASEVISLTFFHDQAQMDEIFQKASTLRELVELDHSIESLGLLFAEDVLNLHGAVCECGCEVSDSGAKVIFRLVFS